jgi:hypothetical protein
MKGRPSGERRALPSSSKRAPHEAAMAGGRPSPGRAPRRGRETALYTQDLPEGCARFYWLARDVFGDHNPAWTAAKIIALIQWFTMRGDIGDEAFVKWHKWLMGTHRNGQYDHMPPAYRYRLPELEARYREHVAKLGG